MIHLSTSLSHYKRPEIQEAIVEHAAGKEVAARFNDKFGKRPDSLQYPNDVLEIAKNGATSFHCSEELWRNPLSLRPLMNRKELDDLRIGWDLVLDIDCKFVEYSKIAADLIVKALKHHNITSLSIKFSGNKGFHIAIPFQSFPQEINGTDVKLLFPEAAKRVALYIKEKIQSSLGKQILATEGNNYQKIAEKTGKKISEISSVHENTAELNVEPFLAIDTLLISSRHMYRMPYSLHEKSGLVSIPVNPEKILEFNLEQAKPEAVKVSEIKFLERENAKPEEAMSLFTDAFDATVQKPEFETEKKEYEIPAEAVPEKFFPPCIQKLLLGMEDGRKRALFILTNFLASCGWSYEAIEERLKQWNQKNKEPLHQTYFLGQLRYHKQHKKKILPPNCSNPAYYRDLRVKCSEEICKFKNPVGYARKRSS
ncbi:hypothetical protein CMO88_01835 [Candidatus Woesearchaeota archaeon]|nr:hypothetical protein [Candidatus Woesearchaeota archaeon]|tara:strand:+ start:7383 stop:8660 length:1278 start_codon:yes stop_codon:yes gene_type:complete